MCETWARDGDRLLYWPSSTFSYLLACSTVGHRGPKALCLPLALNLASCLQLTQAVCVLVILFLLFNVHLLPLIYTDASLDWRLGRRSICYNPTRVIISLNILSLFWQKKKKKKNVLTDYPSSLFLSTLDASLRTKNIDPKFEDDNWLLSSKKFGTIMQLGEKWDSTIVFMHCTRTKN